MKKIVQTGDVCINNLIVPSGDVCMKENWMFFLKSSEESVLLLLNFSS
jgi:hypothetical protein